MPEDEKKRRVDPIEVRVKASGAPGGRIVSIRWPDQSVVEICAGSEGDKRFVSFDRQVDLGPGVQIPEGARIFVPRG